MITILALTAGTSSHAHSDVKKEPVLSFETKKVADNVYILSGVGGFTGGNIALTMGDEAVVMIDNGLPSVIDILRKEIAKTTDKPIDYLINTHVHGDHTGNNAIFASNDARIISHNNLRKSLIEKGIALGNGETTPAPKAHLPVLTFSDQMSLHINDDTLKIQHFAAAHTDADAVVIFENTNVIHTGDILFNTIFPYIDVQNGGSFNGVVAALTSIHAMADDKTIIIPGHGPLATKADVAKTLQMLNSTYNAVKVLHDKGMSEQEILNAKPLNPFDSYSWAFINTETMTKQILTALQ